MGQKDNAQSGYFDDKVRFADACIGIIGIENQTKVDYSMVFRTMKAEALSYAKQWNELEKRYTREGKLKKDKLLAWSDLGKESRFIPVIMVVIYFGTDKEWDGAKCLYDMLDMCEELKPYVNNYRMNLFDYHLMLLLFPHQLLPIILAVYFPLLLYFLILLTLYYFV